MPRLSFPSGLSTAFRLAPLAGALFLMAADGGPCSINIDNDGDDDEECVDLDRACPNLTCDFGFVEVDGCEICECAEEPIVCDNVDFPPECGNARLTDDCRWTCEPDGCNSDRDCGDGFFCAFLGSDEPSRPGDDEADRAAPEPIDGVCLPLEEPNFCTSDSDCSRGFVCEFSDTTGGGAAPPAPDEEEPGQDPDEGRPEDPAAFVAGTCVPADQGCFSDEECGRGQHCELFGTPTGLVAAEGICVDDIPVSECESDRECESGRCELECRADPNCPECDVCFFVGTCVDEETQCFFDGDCAEDEFCAIRPQLPPECDPADANCKSSADRIAPSGICLPRNEGCNADSDCGNGQCIDGVCVVNDSCTSDGDCARGEFCDLGGARRLIPCFDEDGDGECDPFEPIEGVCRPFEEPSCTSDRECGEGQACLITDSCFCDTECRPAPGGTCEPCGCPEPTGICVDVTPNDQCFSDEECARGQVCELRAEGCERPACEMGPDGEEVCHACDPILVGVCVDQGLDQTCLADDDCGDGEFCAYDDGADPAPCFAPDGCDAARPARTGVCRELETNNPCATVRCAEGTCQVDPRGNAFCSVDQGCYGDNECSDGLVCNADVVCMAPPGCEPGRECPAVCYGQCVPPDER